MLTRRAFIEATTIGDLVDRAASQRTGDAVVFPGERVTFPELAALTDDYAASLHALGVEPGEKVGILMPNRLEFIAALVGAAKLGAIVVPINGRFREYELGHVVCHADIRVLLTAAGPGGAADYPGLLAGMLPALSAQDPARLELAGQPRLRQIVDLGSSGHAGFLTADAFHDARRGVDLAEIRARQQCVRIRDIALLMYTSGTTSHPKGCLLTHEAVVRHGINVARSRFSMTEDDRFWDPLPLFHIGGIVPLLGCLGIGATYCHAGHFDADVSLDMLVRERCTVLYPAFETIWLAVLYHPRFDARDLDSVRLIQNIAVPERLRQMQELLPGAAQVSSYGATECSSNLTLPLPDDPEDVRIGTLGPVVPGMQLKIVDPETRAELPPGEVGELAFRGYARFEGYYKDPKLTASVVDEEGWFYSADLASVDEAGRLVYGGRLKDMLKVGGENVSALEVEGFILTHEAVQIAQVVGAPDARYVEVPAAFVQLREGARLGEQELINYCTGRIASFKVPRYVRFVDDWPMSGTKIQKFLLRERIQLELAERGVVEAPRIEARSHRSAAPSAETRP